MDKRFANRKLRRITKTALRGWTEDTVLPELREVSDIWCFNIEAWHWFDPEERPEWMRK